MNHRKLKTLAMSAAVLTIALAMTACSSGGGKDNASGASPSASSSESASASPAMASESPSESASAEPQIMTGKFNGLTDSHTIEIETGIGAVAYQVDAETAEKVSTWEPGTSVKFQYKENTITVIEKE
ncbi:hypothetical protein GE107_13480 [Cohnella sp. CFH 77786]|uniref:hypothetical protein n=1 Tax=Cohnella sp. CFH 77786 TaxID=2662265 RepID=UPI001C610DFA|nr:hypothetical protein [Cohnella sp. CFH 77786]MBW5447075.1 hypothetical protein [Cohnella sp. CFH 77786]